MGIKCPKCSDGEFVKPIQVWAGLTDGVQTVVRGEDITEGMEIVVGESANLLPLDQAHQMGAAWERTQRDRALVTDFVVHHDNGVPLQCEDRYVNRATLGFTYRPVPLVAFQLAYERTWTDNGKSLASVTNFIPARRSEDTQNSFLFGVAFGF